MSVSRYYEVRLKNGTDVFSRHIEAHSPEHARDRVKSQGRVLSVRKVHPEDIIGTIESMNLKDIIGVPPRIDTYSPEFTLDNIVFKNNRRFNNGERKGKYRRESDGNKGADGGVF